MLQLQVEPRRKTRRRRKVSCCHPALAADDPGKKKAVQSDPPRVGLRKLLKEFPAGEEVEYTNSRTTDAEARERERLLQDDPMENYQNIRRAGEVHRQVRAYAQQNIKPGMSMIEIAEMIEDGTRALVEENGFESGIGFPTGLSVNEVAAHYTPNAGDTKVLQQSDVLKVDFGVHVNGRIVDSAFTMTWEPTYDRLLEAVKDATNAGVREAGIDVRMCDIGDAIQEVMESYEVEVGGKTLPVKSISNLSGHSIHPYSIHGTKSVPIVKHFGSDRDETKMEEGEYFAIETFGSTGRGRVIEEGACSHYGLSKNLPERYSLRWVSPFAAFKHFIDRTQPPIGPFTAQVVTKELWHFTVLQAILGPIGRKELSARGESFVLICLILPLGGTRIPHLSDS